MTNWLDVIPYSPLAQGVPVVVRPASGKSAHRWRGIAVYGHDISSWHVIGGLGLSWGPLDSRSEWCDARRICVDLSDDLGFTHVAMYWLRVMVERGEGVAASKRYQFWMQRCALDELTDEDRLDLAQALAKAKGGE